MTQRTDHPISTFGKRLQKYRKTQKIGAENLAELMNSAYGEGTTTRSIITAIETGRKTEGITLAEAIRFSRVLQISPLCLIADLEQPFLLSDFPAFDGLTNFQVVRSFGKSIYLPWDQKGAEKTCTVWNATMELYEKYNSVQWRLNTLEKYHIGTNASVDKDGFYEADEDGITSTFRLSAFADHLVEEWQAVDTNKHILKREGVVHPRDMREFAEIYDDDNLRAMLRRIKNYMPLTSDYTNLDWENIYFE